MSGEFTDVQRGALLAMKKWCQDYIQHVDRWIETGDEDAVHEHLDRLDKIAEEYPPAGTGTQPGSGASVKRKQL